MVSVVGLQLLVSLSIASPEVLRFVSSWSIIALILALVLFLSCLGMAFVSMYHGANVIAVLFALFSLCVWIKEGARCASVSLVELSFWGVASNPSLYFQD